MNRIGGQPLSATMWDLGRRFEQNQAVFCRSWQNSASHSLPGNGVIVGFGEHLVRNEHRNGRISPEATSTCSQFIFPRTARPMR